MNPPPKISKVNFIRIKSFNAVKILVKSMKRQASGWGIQFANHVPERELVSRMSEEFSSRSSKNTSDPVRNRAKT